MGNASAIFRDLWKSLREKLKESLFSVVPVSLLVFLLAITPWVDISRHELLVFAGADAVDAQCVRGKLESMYPRSEVILQAGGQPVYEYILVLI